MTTICSVTLLLLIVFVCSYLFFIEQTTCLLHQGYSKSGHGKAKAMPSKWETMMKEKQTLKARLAALESETKAMASLIELEKEIRRQLNVTVVEKTALLERHRMASRRDGNQTQELQKQKKMLQANAALYRHFFDHDARVLYNSPYPGVGNYKRYTVARLGMLPLTGGLERLRPEFGSAVHNVTSFRYVMSVAPCQQPASSVHQSAVFIAVLSAPENYRRRELIRQTWATHLAAEYQRSSNSNLTVVGFAFVMGRVQVNETQSKIQEENRKFGDVIQIETPDSGSQQSLDKMAGLFHWLYAHCSHMHFLLKVEDNVYVNVRNLAHFASQYRPRFNDSMFGTTPPTFATKRAPSGDLSSHSYEEWPWSHYPPHLLGHAVLLANSTIRPLLAAIQTTPRLAMDDLYYTGVCREKAGIPLGSSSTSISGVLATTLPDNPTPCYLRQFITLLTSNEAQMTNWHVATDDFYRNKTFCLVNATMNATTNATSATNYQNQLFTFNFTDANI